MSEDMTNEAGEDSWSRRTDDHEHSEYNCETCEDRANWYFMDC